MISGSGYEQCTVKDYSRILMPMSYILTTSYRFTTIVSELYNTLGINTRNLA